MNVLLIVSIVMHQSIPVEINNNVFFSSDYLLGGIAIKESDDVETIIAHILTAYANAGFPFCRVLPKVTYQDSTPVKIVLAIEEGDRIIIKDYLFTIHGKSLVGVVRKIAQVKKHIYFSHREVEKVKRNILATEVFDTVSDRIILDNDTYYLLFSLQERMSDYLTVFGSFAEDEFTFSASLHSINLLGTLRRLRFLYEYQKLFSLEFEDPILIYPTRLTGAFGLWSYDSVRLVQVTGNITAPIGEMFTLSLLSGLERSSSFRGGSLLAEETSSLLGIGGSMNIFRRVWSTEHSFLYDYLFRSQNRWRVTYHGVLRFFRIEVRPHYYYVHSDSFHYFDYIRIGGSQNLRGYRNEEFIVQDARWVNIEYRKFIVFPLIDVALLDHNVKYSYGFGIEAQSRFGRAQLMFAWPRHGTWREGKIHFVLEKGFN